MRLDEDFISLFFHYRDLLQTFAKMLYYFFVTHWRLYCPLGRDEGSESVPCASEMGWRCSPCFDGLRFFCPSAVMDRKSNVSGALGRSTECKTTRSSLMKLNNLTSGRIIGQASEELSQ